MSDLLGLSARRMLNALAEGETNALALAALADRHLRATEAQLCDALGACTELNAVYRRLLKMALEELQLIEEQMDKLEQEMAPLLRQHEDAVKRLLLPQIFLNPRSISSPYTEDCSLWTREVISFMYGSM